MSLDAASATERRRSPMNEQFNVRLPGYTLEQIDLLCSTYGLTKTQVTILAFDRLTLALDPERIGFDETQDILKVMKAPEAAE